MRPVVIIGCAILGWAGVAFAAQGPGDRSSLAIGPGTSCTTANCHDKGFAGKKAHVPSRTGNCRVCHVPMKERHIFRPAATKEKMCLGCHDAFRPPKEHVFHSAITADGCTGCHDPHSSGREYLLRSEDLVKLCSRCHGSMTKGHKLAHEALEDADSCSLCHANHSSQFGGLLKREPVQGCLICHRDVRREMRRGSVHSPARDACTHCHVPHASNESHLLSGKIPGLCFKCHPDTRDVIRAAHPSKAPAAQGKCLACHGPHASSEATLLRKERNVGCLDCHPDLAAALKQERGKQEPVHGRKCLDCHAPHGSRNPHALKKRFPKGFYRSATDRPDKVCFGCHDESIANREDSTGTKFRDGERNLHFVHAKAGQGRSCNTCHPVHAMRPSRFLRRSVPVGRLSMPLKFEKTLGGGRCLAGCHIPQGYDRMNPVGARKPETDE